MSLRAATYCSFEAASDSPSPLDAFSLEEGPAAQPLSPSAAAIARHPTDRVRLIVTSSVVGAGTMRVQRQHRRAIRPCVRRHHSASSERSLETRMKMVPAAAFRCPPPRTGRPLLALALPTLTAPGAAVGRGA